eukprot:14358694-Alexandrium_andersonii.AAC.1
MFGSSSDMHTRSLAQNASSPLSAWHMALAMLSRSQGADMSYRTQGRHYNASCSLVAAMPVTSKHPNHSQSLANLKLPDM